MKVRKVNLVFIIAAVLMVLVFVVIFYFYNKPHLDIKDAEAVTKVSSKELSVSYNEDEDKANVKYLGKVIEVEGKLISKERTASDGNTIMLEGYGPSMVLCRLSESEQSFENYKEGKPIVIKGICIGFLLDVSMRDCVIVNE